MISANRSDIAILNIKGVHYCCVIIRISKSAAVKLLQSSNLADENRVF